MYGMLVTSGVNAFFFSSAVSYPFGSFPSMLGVCGCSVCFSFCFDDLDVNSAQKAELLVVGTAVSMVVVSGVKGCCT